jgi:hypothetical protein
VGLANCHGFELGVTVLSPFQSVEDGLFIEDGCNSNSGIFGWMQDTADSEGSSPFFFLPLTTFLAHKACEWAPHLAHLHHIKVVCAQLAFWTEADADQISRRLGCG